MSVTSKGDAKPSSSSSSKHSPSSSSSSSSSSWKTPLLILLFSLILGVSHQLGYIRLDTSELNVVDVVDVVDPVSSSNTVDVTELTQQAQSSNQHAIKLLGLHHALTFLQESDPTNVEYLQPNHHSEQAQNLFEKAAEFHCEAHIWHGLLKLTLGELDQAEAAFEEAAKGNNLECVALRDAHVGIVAEFRGDQQRAKELYAEARKASEHIWENWFERDFDATDPVTLNETHFQTFLSKLAAFRTFYEEFFRLRDDANAMDFSTKSIEKGGNDIRGGTKGLEGARDHLEKHGFVILRSFLSPWETRVIQYFYKWLIDINIITNFDPNLARTSTYNDRMSHWFGQRFTDVMTEIGGRPLKHVYSFLCWHSVREGNPNRPRLLPHTDREDNDYTVSIQMHYNDESGETAWPVWVHKKKQSVAKAGWKEKPPLSESLEVRMADGDAVLFRGRSYIHWRDDMPQTGKDFSSLLLHFVHREWDWKDFKYVRQKADPTI